MAVIHLMISRTQNGDLILKFSVICSSHLRQLFTCASWTAHGRKCFDHQECKGKVLGGLHPKNDVGATANDTLLVPFGTPKWSTINSALSKWDYAHRILGGRMSLRITPSWGFLIASIAGGNVERKWPVLSRHDKSTGRAPTTYHTTMFRFCSLGCGLGFRTHLLDYNTPRFRFSNKFTV